jgi:RND superfamily putative drug exporter
VFTVLGVLPVIVLTEIGVIVGLGVLLDSLLVRTVLVPALVYLIGDPFWAPGRLSRPAAPREEPAIDGVRPRHALVETGVRG